MNDNFVIKCPHCKGDIHLTETLAAPIIEGARKKIVSEERDKARVEFEAERNKLKVELGEQALQIEQAKLREAELDAKFAETQKAQAEILKKSREIEEAKLELDLTVQKKVTEEAEKLRLQLKKDEQERANLVIERESKRISEEMEGKLVASRKILEEEREKVNMLFKEELESKNKELSDLKERENDQRQKLEEAQKAQAQALKKSREYEDKERELELTIEKRVMQESETLRARAKQESDEQNRLKLMEREQTIASMQKTIAELQQKADQGSQQLQGEVLELELESMLKANFPFDSVEPVPKGTSGADVIQTVNDHGRGKCGTIIWELKRTKAWSDGWLSKLRDDQRSAKAEIAVIVSFALPKDIEMFGFMEGVWVLSPKAILPVVMMLRQSLIEISKARQISEGAKTKSEVMYEYLTGTKFIQRMSAIVEAFQTMQEDLGAEKKAIQKQWAKRESQINRVMESTIGMYGDMQGIAGKSLREIEGLEFKALQ
ncbi:MAG: DUF2130 domain-containing protein [Synergistaceae bacterium]|nr:DUF2130 domain-containing protein [Synergistaceae bacterium]